MQWWSFSNDEAAFSSSGNGSSGGSFDPTSYHKMIELIGEWSFPFDHPYEDGIPTDLLWDPSWKSKVRDAIDQARREADKR